MQKGDTIGHLTLIEEVFKCDDKRKRKFWKCYCNRCGNYAVIREDNLKDKRNKHPSCGCLRRWRRYHYLTYKEKQWDTSK